MTKKTTMITVGLVALAMFALTPTASAEFDTCAQNETYCVCVYTTGAGYCQDDKGEADCYAATRTTSANWTGWVCDPAFHIGN